MGISFWSDSVGDVAMGDTDKTLMLDGFVLVSPTNDLWSQHDKLIDRYVERAGGRLQAQGFIPRFDGVMQDARYEHLINNTAQEMYEQDAPLSG